VRARPQHELPQRHDRHAEFLFDVGDNLQKGTYDTDPHGNETWSFYAVGEKTPGSNDSGAIVYPTSAYDPNDPKRP
jgi:hypothetical protein